MCLKTKLKLFLVQIRPDNPTTEQSKHWNISKNCAKKWHVYFILSSQYVVHFYASFLFLFSFLQFHTNDVNRKTRNVVCMKPHIKMPKGSKLHTYLINRISHKSIYSKKRERQKWKNAISFYASRVSENFYEINLNNFSYAMWFLAIKISRQISFVYISLWIHNVSYLL